MKLITTSGLLLKLGSYGATRITSVINFKLSLAWCSSAWVILSLLSGIITFIQTDLKKIIAYRRVTHITLMI
jgi:NADH:ubiquinone oxidoreductase subunit 4 (subunit M)